MRRNRNSIFSLSLDQIDLRLLVLRTPLTSTVERMVTSLKERGQLTPIIIAEDSDVSMLVDGFKRYEAARSIGLDSLKATCLTADPKQAKAMMYLLNRAGSFSMIQEAMLVRELVDSDGFTQAETATLLDRHKSWVSRRLMMIRRLAPQIIEDLKLELLPPGSAPALARMPPCNQADFSVTIQAHRLSAKEIRTVIDLWCKAHDPGTKHFLLTSPHEALAIIEQEKEKRTTPHTTLRSIGKLITTFDNQLEGAMEELGRETILRLRELLHQVTSILSVMQHSLEKERL